MDDEDHPLFNGFDRRDGPLQWHIADRARVMGIVMDTAPNLMVYWSRDLVCQFANKAYADWFERPLQDMMGLHIETLLGAAMALTNKPYIDGVLAGRPQRFEQRLQSPSRGQISTLTQYIPDFVAGKVVGFCAHLTDVSLLKETERALRDESSERQRANEIIRAGALALEESQRLGQIGSWILITPPDEVRWSKELYRIMGRDPDLPPPSFAEHHTMLAPQSWADLRRHVDITLSTGQPFRVELEFIRPDGDRGWCESRGEAVHGDAGRIIGLRGTVRNMTPDHAPSSGRPLARRRHPSPFADFPLPWRKARPINGP